MGLFHAIYAVFVPLNYFNHHTINVYNMDFCSSTYSENSVIFCFVKIEQGWKYKDVFNNIKIYQGKGDGFTKQKIPLFSLFVVSPLSL